MDSNILLGSNVYILKKDRPLHDSDFVRQIQDYELLKAMDPFRSYDSVQFNAKQENILRIGLRCVYAKYDPCWGYDGEKGCETCACIKGDCPKIYECNKNYTFEEAKYWSTSKEDRDLYGEPQNQRVQYFVDMIPDSEMRLYSADPQNEGYEYSAKNPVIKDSEEKETRIDPLTGRKMVVVGTKWQIIDSSDYQNEEIVKIWNYVEDAAVKKIKKTKKSARIEKLEPSKEKNVLSKIVHKHEEKEEEQDYLKKEDFEKSVSESINDEFSIMELLESYEPGVKWVIVVTNPAEKAYVSSMLMKSEIIHGFGEDDDVQLIQIAQLKNCANKTVIVSSNLCKNGCTELDVQGWKTLASEKSLVKVNIPEREYYKYEYSDGLSRWTCRDTYGIKHVCIEDSDIDELDFGTDGLYPISIADNMVISEYGDAIGGVSEQFTKLMNSLVESKEIEAIPSEIEGIFVNVKNGTHIVLGMGHLKFDAY